MISSETIEQYRSQAKDLIAQMTLDEKISQTVSASPAIPRLGIPAYNWWNEALHGVARAGTATVFPQAIGLAATFDTDLMRRIGDVIATEGRAKYNLSQSLGDCDTYKGLTFWSPNINIFRDPRWGRGHETYGEDPYLTGEMGCAYIRGVQTDNGKHRKAAACVKHFVAHSGPESCRQGYNADVSDKDFYETYLPAFAKCIREGQVEAVMGAYNAVNGEICCGSRKLLTGLLRDELGFRGHVVSDCGAVVAIEECHKAVPTEAEAAALSLKSGCDLNSAGHADALREAVRKHLITEDEIDVALERLFTTRFCLGILGEKSEYDAIPYTENDSSAHRQLNLTAAEKSLTLLKNNGILPLDKGKTKTIAVIGPNADSVTALLGNYHGTPSEAYTILGGLRCYLQGENIRILYAPGCHLFRDRIEPNAGADDRMAEAVGIASLADVVLLCTGLDATIEGEQGDAFNGDGSGDKPDLSLPGRQNILMQKILTVGKPTVILNVSGSAVDLRMAQEQADAVVQCWYPGAMGGLAVARMLFGEFSPSGRLPVTFYRSADDLPDFCDYSMQGRTYRFFDGEVLYPFGFGLSYTNFSYGEIQPEQSTIQAGEPFVCRVTLTNTGHCDGDEVAELYLKENTDRDGAPRWQLKGFQHVFLKSGESRELTFTVPPEELQTVGNDGSVRIEKGTYTVFIGGSQPDETTRRTEFEII